MQSKNSTRPGLNGKGGGSRRTPVDPERQVLTTVAAGRPALKSTSLPRVPYCFHSSNINDDNPDGQ
jgi:hypothetical protein